MSEPYGPGPAYRRPPAYPPPANQPPAYSPAGYPSPAQQAPAYPQSAYPPAPTQPFQPVPYPPPPFPAQSQQLPASFSEPDTLDGTNRRWLPFGIAAGVVALIVIVVGVLYLRSGQPTSSTPAVQGASEACGKIGQMSLAGKQLFLNMSGTDRNSGALTSVEILCVLNHLHTP